MQVCRPSLAQELETPYSADGRLTGPLFRGTLPTAPVRLAFLGSVLSKHGHVVWDPFGYNSDIVIDSSL